MPSSPYDEFAYFAENIDEWRLDVAVPTVRRFGVVVDGLRQVSGLAWGDEAPSLVLLHGGGQNAHTFDTVALALQRPLLALDLPGHGHADPAPYPYRDVDHLAQDVTVALEQLLERPAHLVGMSLGGLVGLLVARRRPDLVRSLTLIDITPGVTEEKARQVTDFVNGPATFPDFDALLERTIAHHPNRSTSSLRRGILHNALERADGTWIWRHQRGARHELHAPLDTARLWDELEHLDAPLTLVRALGPGSVVTEDDVNELRRRRPDAVIVEIAGAGHSIQGDAPLELARVLAALSA